MRAGPMRCSAIVLGAALLVVLWTAPASAVPDCSIACTPPAYTSCHCADDNPGDPCILTTLQDDAAPGAVIDCSDTDIVLRDRIWIANGVVTLLADDVTVESGHRIEATQVYAGVPFGMRLELTGVLTVNGQLSAKSDLGGGSVKVQAQRILLNNSGSGGGIVAQATASGGHGGRIELVSKADMILNDQLIADGSALGATKGGLIVVDAEGQVTIHTKLSTFGHQIHGGVIRISSRTGTVDIQGCGIGCVVKAEGGDPNGNGGGIFVRGHQIVVGALLSAQGGLGTAGGLSTGGTVQFEAESGGITLNADINVTGGEGGAGLDGGAIVAESDGQITIGNGAKLATKSDANGGDGGDVRLFAIGAVTLNSATIDARGHWGGAGEGTGASVELEGCTVSVNPGALIDVRGFNGGAVTLSGRDALTVNPSSTIETTSFGGEPGSIALVHRRPGRCSGDLTGCDPGRCAVQGTCSNNAALHCTTNANCTVGCSTGQCIRKCRGDPTRQCTNDAGCEPCTSGQCVTNPDTGNSVVQFKPGPPELDENRDLEPCDSPGGAEP